MKLFSTFFAAAPAADPVAAALRGADIATAPGPWRPLAPRAIGGLTALGFARGDDTLLVTSANGQSVIDGTSGEIRYRNREADGVDPAALKGTRLDHPADERFDLAGLYGGGLRSQTNDGWSVEVLGLEARAMCLLHPPNASIHNLRPERAAQGKEARFCLMGAEREPIRAFGFSWTGRCLALATPSTLLLWARPMPLALG